MLAVATKHKYKLCCHCYDSISNCVGYSTHDADCVIEAYKFNVNVLKNEKTMDCFLYFYLSHSLRSPLMYDS